MRNIPERHFKIEKYKHRKREFINAEKMKEKVQKKNHSNHQLFIPPIERAKSTEKNYEIQKQNEIKYPQIARHVNRHSNVRRFPRSTEQNGYAKIIKIATPVRGGRGLGKMGKRS